MWIRVDPLSAEPLFRQVVFQVKAAVAEGRMAHGEKLPSVRELSRALAINPNTVAKAYGALEGDGVIVRRQGAGCFVKHDDRGRSRDSCAAEVEREMRRVVTDAFHLGLDPDEMRAALERAIRVLRASGDEARKAS